MTLRVFLSYAREDQQRAASVYDRLSAEGVEPWMDVKRLLPGQNWEAEIQRAFESANVVMLLLSKTSVNKRGFVQREANEAVDRLRYKQPTDIYVIPVLLEPCDVPSHIAGRLQYVDLSTAAAWQQVRASLALAADQQSIALTTGARVGPFLVTTRKVGDRWDGKPGHNIELEYPEFFSNTAPDLARELSLFFAGRAADRLISSRQKPWDQSPEYFAKANSFATNERWENYEIVHATDRFVSVLYNVGWYGAGAAHGNSHFETYNFAYQNRVLSLELSDFFADSRAAMQRVSDACLRELRRMYWERTGEKPDDRQEKWFLEGAGPSIENFRAFTVTEDRFAFFFPPYQVSAYALGPWTVDVSFFEVLETMRTDGIHTLARPSNQS